jgi:hypothetical protein
MGGTPCRWENDTTAGVTGLAGAVTVAGVPVGLRSTESSIPEMQQHTHHMHKLLVEEKDTMYVLCGSEPEMESHCAHSSGRYYQRPSIPYLQA